MAEIRWQIVAPLQYAQGWSDRRLANRMGFSASHFCEVKHGKKPASIDFIDKLCEVLQIRYDRILRHPSFKPDDVPAEDIITKIERGQLSGLCRDPEHGLLSEAQERQRERVVARAIPRAIRRRWWQPTRWAK